MSAERIKPKQIGKPPKVRRPTELQQKIIETHQTHPTLNKSEIAAYCKTDHAHVIRTLQTYGIVKEDVDAYINKRAAVLAGMQYRLLSSITSEDIKKAPVGSRILAIAQLYDKERLERGLSNAEQPIMVIIRNSVQVEANGQAGENKADIVDITPGDKALHHITP